MNVPTIAFIIIIIIIMTTTLVLQNTLMYH